MTGATSTAGSTALPSDTAEPPRVRSLMGRAFRPLVWRLLAMSVFVNLLTLAAPVFVLQVYDRVIPHSGFETLKALVIGVIALIAFDFALRRARGRAVQMATLRIDVALTRALFERLTRQPLRALERRSDAEWRVLLRDADTVRDAAAGPATLLALDLPFVALFFLGVWLAAPPLGMLLLVLIPVFIGVAALSSWVVGGAAKQEQDAALKKQALSEEIVSGRATVKTLGLGAALKARWEAAQAASMQQSALRGAGADGFNQVGQSLMLMSTVLLTTVGAVAIVNQQMTIGGLIAANMLAARIVQPLTQLIGLWRSAARFREAAARLDTALAEPIDRPAAEVARPRPRGALTAEGVSFGYAAEGDPLIRALSTKFEPGTTVGVVGENGSGKSTFLKLLMGRYAPASGRVLLDGADLAQFGDAELGRWFGYAPQEPFLFAGTIRDNIAGGRADLTDAQILEAAELASVDAFARRLPEGYGSEVGEGGRRLPPGHRQRIALARALVGDPAALILDEPSANLDHQAEQALAQRLDALKRGRVVVLVSHSNTLLSACDEILVMHNGRIAMRGPASEMTPKPAPRREPAAAAPTQRVSAPVVRRAAQGGAQS